MTATITETDPLEALDYHEPVDCGHSEHDEDKYCHNGPATHYAQIIHQCPADPAQGYVYPCCQPYTDYVQAMQGEPWMCPHCRECHDGADMVRIIATIEGGTA